VKEKDQHIEQLLKEREMERSEVTRAAAQADEAEHQLALLQRRFQEEQENAAMKISELESLLGPLETARLNQTAQIDDLQFRLEEEMILRTDTESQCKLLEEKEKETCRQLEEERSRAERLEIEAQRCFEAEEQATRYKDLVDSLQEELASISSARSASNDTLETIQTDVAAKDKMIADFEKQVSPIQTSLR